MPCGPVALGRKRGADRVHARQHVGEKDAVQGWLFGHDGRRLTQIRGRVKKPLVLGQGEPVGHPGDEIADPAGALGLVVSLSLPSAAIPRADRPAICG